MKVEDIYLTLLRQAVLGKQEDVRFDNGAHLVCVWQLALQQGTSALVGNELLKCNIVSDPTLLAQIKMLCMQAMMGQQRQMAALKRVWGALKEAGIGPVLLKGFGLAQLYPLPYLRQWGDADIWVGHGNYEKVTEAICKTMNVTWHHESEDENERHYNFNTEDGFVFEIHPQTIRWVLSKEDKRYRALEEEAMAHCETIDVEGQTFHIPERGFNQLFVFLHAWEHFTSSGTNMKQLADLALLCQREPLPKRFYEALRPLGMLEPWEVMGYAVVKLFGLKKECWTGYNDCRRVKRLGDRLCREILEPLTLKDRCAERPLRCMTADVERYPKLLRKLGTLWERVKTARKIGKVSPKYGRHYLWMAIVKGMRRWNV